MANDKIKLLKKSISNIDIFILVKEMDKILQDGFISNIYEIPSPDGKVILLKCRSKDGKKNIIIDPKKRINITQFSYPTPQFPSQFIMSLRKFMKGRRIERIYQHNYDRIIVIQLKSADGEPWRFIIEFFGGGNYILVDGQGLTYMAKSYKKMRERSILAKKPYQFPSSRGVDLWDLSEEDFKSKLSDTAGELVRNIARTFNVGGYISEEICLRAKIEKKTPISDLSDADLSNLYQQVSFLNLKLQNHEFSPRIILDPQKNPIGFEGIEFELYKSFPFEEKQTFNIAIDDFFSKFDSEIIFAGDVVKSNKQLKKTQKILKEQMNKIDESIQKREKALEHGHLIYQYLNEIETLISIIMIQKREKKLSWAEISQKLIEGKEKDIPECLIFNKISQKEVKVVIDLEGHQFKLDLKKSAIENAQDIYTRAKKAKKKIVGARKAVEITKDKITKQEEQHLHVEARKAVLLKKPKSKWYEKYRWFKSSDGFLIVGGKDASSNEFIVKKHMNSHDLFFHADVRGASVCIIKNDNNEEIPERTLLETANFASVYSSAWKQGWGNTDIFYVYPNQVSKTPKSGEFLKKGSFIISGTKNFLQKPYLKIAIGVSTESSDWFTLRANS